MVDFNGFDKGVIGKKLPSDTTLNNMRKADLIELLHLAESNHRVLAETYKIAVDTSKCKSCPLSLDGQESYQQGREDAIYEFKERLLDLCGGGEECIECVGGNCTGCLENSVDYSSIVDLAEELKEQKKCPNGKNPHWTCYEVCEHRENGICTLNN